MRLWSVQHKNAYDTMISTGTLQADEKYEVPFTIKLL